VAKVTDPHNRNSSEYHLSSG